jgi:primosomal protein N' (replication factor Y)
MSKIAQIIPAVRLKRSLNYFDYSIPDELESQIQIGQIVEIPFRNQNVRGVVLNLPEKTESSYELKPLNKIIDSAPLLSNWQLELIKFMSAYYFVSMAMVLKMVMPEIPKRQSSKFKDMRIEFVSNNANDFDVSDIFRSPKPLLLAYSSFSDKISVYSHVIKYNIEQNKQTVIIVPELKDLEEIYKHLGSYKDNISILLNDLSKSKLWQEWQKIKSGQAKVIIGTRSAIFAPFDNLGTIIIDEESNPNHKQEEPNPRYNAKTVALKIGELTKAKVIFSALTPSLNSLYRVQTKAWDYLELDKPKEFPQITIIDRQDEFKKGNYSAFGEKLQQSIESNLEQKKKTFLFLNRKGSATLVSCKDCGYIAICPTCHLPLTFYKKDKLLICHHCDYKTGMILTCPTCKSVELKLTGTGTEKAEQDLQKLFPQAKIAIIDQENQNQDKIKDADIIIGTQYAFDFINWQEIQTIGVLNADILLYLPDYRSSEKTFNLLKQLILSIPDQQKEFFAQTMAPENFIFSTIRILDLKQFYRHEIKERRDLNYPPFSHLIKIIHQGVDFNGGEEEIQEVYKVLKLKVKSDGSIVLNPPALAYTQQVRGRFRWQIIIKVLGSELNLDFLNDLPENLIIDIDPESLN